MARIGRDLIAQARMLAFYEHRRPKQATLRRAISTAYYGLFHFLIEESSWLLFGGAPDDAEYRQLAARAFVHAKMKSACKEFVKPNLHDVHELLKPLWTKMGIANNPDAKLIGKTFIDLQDDRHTGDYDLSITFSRQDALNSVTRAESAVAAWQRLRTANPEVCRVFGMTLLLWPSLSSR